MVLVSKNNDDSLELFAGLNLQVTAEHAEDRLEPTVVCQ